MRIMFQNSELKSLLKIFGEIKGHFFDVSLLIRFREQQQKRVKYSNYLNTGNDDIGKHDKWESHHIKKRQGNEGFTSC